MTDAALASSFSASATAFSAVAKSERLMASRATAMSCAS